MAISAPHQAISNLPGQAIPPPEGGAGGIRRSPGGPFSQFLQTVSPDPVPTKWQFYRQNIRDHFFKSYWTTNTQYYKNLKKNPGMISWVGGVSLGLGVLFTTFTGLRSAIHYLAGISALAIPVVQGTKTLPKMSEAYQKVKDGNPTEGRAQFGKALNDYIYNIFQVFLKPMSFGFVAASVLSLPRVFRPNVQLLWSEKEISARLMRWLHIREHNPLIRGLDKLYAPLERVGHRIEQHAPEKLMRVAKKLL